MKNIKLTQNKVALVDDDMFDELNQHKWYAVKHRNTFYARRNVYNNERSAKTICMHRQILGLTDKNIYADHRDLNGLNNQKDNIRACSHSENARNLKSHIGSTSKFKGVSFHKQSKKWVSQIMINRKQIHLGLFEDEEAAAKKYDVYAKLHYREYANLNFN